MRVGVIRGGGEVEIWRGRKMKRQDIADAWWLYFEGGRCNVLDYTNRRITHLIKAKPPRPNPREPQNRRFEIWDLSREPKSK
jgi:hypothetical protein